MAPVTLVTPCVGFSVSLATSECFSLANERLWVTSVTPEKHCCSLFQERREEGIWRRRGSVCLDRCDAAAAVPCWRTKWGWGWARGRAAGQTRHCAGWSRSWTVWAGELGGSDLTYAPVHCGSEWCFSCFHTWLYSWQQSSRNNRRADKKWKKLFRRAGDTQEPTDHHISSTFTNLLFLYSGVHASFSYQKLFRNT